MDVRVRGELAEVVYQQLVNLNTVEVQAFAGISADYLCCLQNSRELQVD
jgi:hypothetical protein